MTGGDVIMHGSTVPQFDLLIIGGGVAGLSAAATAADRGLNVGVIEHLGAGGLISSVDHIGNAPAYPEGIAGYELGPALQQQAEDAGASFLFDTAETIAAHEFGFMVTGREGCWLARTVIIASGGQRRTLDIPGEERLEGRGVSHCASCDGPFFRGQDVVVIGGGDAAFHEAQALAALASKVTIVHRRTVPTTRKPQLARIRALANVCILPGRRPVEILGEGAVSGVALDDGTQIAAKAVFVQIGQRYDACYSPIAYDRDSEGRIVTNNMNQSTYPGLFAAGAVRSGSGGTITTAMGDGALAAISAANFVDQLI